MRLKSGRLNSSSRGFYKIDGGVKACYGARDDKAHEKEESLRQDVDSKGSLQQATTNQAGRSPSIPLAIS